MKIIIFIAIFLFTSLQASVHISDPEQSSTKKIWSNFEDVELYHLKAEENRCKSVQESGSDTDGYLFLKLRKVTVYFYLLKQVYSFSRILFSGTLFYRYSGLSPPHK